MHSPVSGLFGLQVMENSAPEWLNREALQASSVRSPRSSATGFRLSSIRGGFLCPRLAAGGILGNRLCSQRSPPW